MSDGGGPDVKVDVPAVGQQRFDGLQHRHVDVVDLGQGGQGRTSGGDGQLGSGAQQWIQMTDCQVRPASRRLDEHRDRVADVLWRCLRPLGCGQQAGQGVGGPPVGGVGLHGVPA